MRKLRAPWRPEAAVRVPAWPGAGAASPAARLQNALLLLALAVLAGCASAPPRDGPPLRVPADLDRVPNAMPRVEPVRPGGPNKPYMVNGRSYQPLSGDVAFSERGGASWYGRAFHGKPTSSGEPYDMFAMTAAHKTLPIPSYVRVRNPANNREVVLRINDRGPFVEGRIIDLSYTAAYKLGLLSGVAVVELRRITNAEIRAAELMAVLAPEPDEVSP